MYDFLGVAGALMLASGLIAAYIGVIADANVTMVERVAFTSSCLLVAIMGLVFVWISFDKD